MLNYRNFKFTDNSFVITFTKKTFSRTASGRYWKAAPDTIESEIFTAENYTNYISSIPFFNNFGGRASCRAYKGYTFAGYIPVKVTTISPDGLKKIEGFFTFTNK